MSGRYVRIIVATNINRVSLFVTTASVHIQARCSCACACVRLLVCAILHMCEPFCCKCANEVMCLFGCLCAHLAAASKTCYIASSPPLTWAIIAQWMPLKNPWKLCIKLCVHVSNGKTCNDFQSHYTDPCCASRCLSHEPHVIHSPPNNTPWKLKCSTPLSDEEGSGGFQFAYALQTFINPIIISENWYLNNVGRRGISKLYRHWNMC